MIWHKLSYAEFYITNACNFDCDGCNSFNNYLFKGHQRWQDYRNLYQTWSHRLHLDSAVIIGGEPMANPDYLDWIRGITEFWPNTQIRLVTNGSLLDADNRELYEILQRANNTLTLQITLHNLERKASVLDFVKSWLRSPVEITEIAGNVDTDLDRLSHIQWRKSYDAVRGSQWPDCDTVDDWASLPSWIQDECRNQHRLFPEDFSSIKHQQIHRHNIWFKDSNGVQVIVSHQNYFYQNALIQDSSTGRLRLNRSDPLIAHNNCGNKTRHTFSRGRLYKCPPVSLFPEFYTQYDLDLTSEEIDSIHSYQSAECSWLDEELGEFIQALGCPVDQCKFCPESYQFKEISAIQRKITFARRTSPMVDR